MPTVNKMAKLSPEPCGNVSCQPGVVHHVRMRALLRPARRCRGAAGFLRQKLPPVQKLCHERVSPELLPLLRKQYRQADAPRPAAAPDGLRPFQTATAPTAWDRVSSRIARASR